MNRLPPLRSMQAFEAVGRTGSVRAAAEELGVSAGAVTQQVRALEARLQQRLLQRSGRGVVLTPWGSLYFQRVSAGMEQLRSAKDDVERVRGSKHLAVSALSSLAVGWLGPLVFEWKKRNPDISIVVEADDLEPRLDTGELDFRVSYGDRHRQHARHTHLFTDRLMAVASPELLAAGPSITGPRSLLKFPLIWVDWGSEYLAPPNWRDWFAAVGVETNDVRRELTVSHGSAAIYAAVEGLGIALAQHSIAASALARGTLVQVMPPELMLPESHFLAWGSGVLGKPHAAAFQAWIVDASRRLG